MEEEVVIVGASIGGLVTAVALKQVVIGCDGVHSVIARRLKLSLPVHSGRSAVRGISVYPEGHGLGHIVQQYVDVSKRAGFVPLNDREVFWFLACKTPPKENVTVLGDAMHPTTPDLGQGGCMALEDAVVLGRHIGNSVGPDGKLRPKEVGHALEKYVRERKWRTAWIIAASLLSGCVQQDGSGWWMKFLRDVFYKTILTKFISIADYDCGRLPNKMGTSNFN
ncbi:hypothetical protein CRG98_020984 [Punica granatum]|uniref:FAD-binding domain-containing protein n=1 Tax=Punica granatum TaxID=22663 RepID=A0A2I0JQN0_PUNGR|nr:hypothetical protein CRG98_020984 [Punica granatum]